ncbi:uncharacterized protein DI49_3667 [Saccharomyces eubayanus]|uniref:uncharacterized protein n=1 Tax=Saccharomyces eubayanus TaxID=1080349 RepID=UPI0006BFEF38|nr:hypothetical protein DI49_3667 [Saccharomyces eubayanus]KOG97850.1 hypothetical protein DI49_3667 [Saccharomyces eubayanus]
MSNTNYNYRNEAMKLLKFTEEMICVAKVPAEMRHRMVTERRFRSQFRKISSAETSINRCEYFDIPIATAQAYITDYEDLGAIYDVNPSVHKTPLPEKISSRQQLNHPKHMTLVTEKSMGHLKYAQRISPELLLADISVNEPNANAKKVENKSLCPRLDYTNTANDVNNAANNANPSNVLENKPPSKRTSPVFNAKSRYTPYSTSFSNVGGLCDASIQYVGQAKTKQAKTTMLFGETTTKERSNRSKTTKHKSPMSKPTFVEVSRPLQTNKRPYEVSKAIPNKNLTVFDTKSRFNSDRVYSTLQKLPSSDHVRSRYNNNLTIKANSSNNSYQNDRALNPPPQYTNYSGAPNTNKKLPKSLKRISDIAKKYHLEED